MTDLVSGVNCTDPSIKEFPSDLFTQEQRASGYVAIHFLVSCYVFYALAIICDDYFVPSVERIANRLKIPSEIAGCTIMGVANSSPELLTNIFGTFVTQGDLGLGMIVGASVFNVLAVGACIGLATKNSVKLQRWPISRDSFFYLLSVAALFQALTDNRVDWWDAAILLILYAVYLTVIFFNSTLKKKVYQALRSCDKRVKSNSYNFKQDHFKGVLQAEGSFKATNDNSSINTLSLSLDRSASITESNESSEEVNVIFSDEETLPLFKLPAKESSWDVWLHWFVGWPIRLAYKVTIPDCKKRRWSDWYPLTFFMCIVWNTALCYVISWMVTVIGHTFSVPDTVMGLTVIAAGTSVPQAVSSIIVARRGYGTMAMNNAIGSNIFNILICLGIPWLLQILISLDYQPYIKIYSKGLGYSTLMLSFSMLFLYVTVASNSFRIGKKLGVIFLVSYLVFLVVGSLFELNVFFTVNMPTCPSDL